MVLSDNCPCVLTHKVARKVIFSQSSWKDVCLSLKSFRFLASHSVHKPEKMVPWDNNFAPFLPLSLSLYRHKKLSTAGVTQWRPPSKLSHNGGMGGTITHHLNSIFLRAQTNSPTSQNYG